MSERRIQIGQPAQPEGEKELARLKNVAGLIRNLSYREMLTLSKALYDTLPVMNSHRDLCDPLLRASDAIINLKDMPR